VASATRAVSLIIEEPPTGGVGQDGRWRNIYDGDEEYPDWLN
jgi:hypothetical protein